MNSSRLESKTVRPGNLGMYSYYRSARRLDPPPRRQTTPFIASGWHRLIPVKALVTVAVVAALIGFPLLFGGHKGDGDKASSTQQKTQKTAPAAPAAAVVAAPAAKTADHCAGNTSAKLLLVSISQRHLWACAQGKTVYDSPVITGMTAYDATVTPTGTYHVYGKQKDTVLTGSDASGSWNDPVSYWMPFLNNQYGTYGFHDATWRADSEFGNVSPDSSDASHGCVELPLASAAWIYNWAAVGTAVSIKS